jgi:hypothetical protein
MGLVEGILILAVMAALLGTVARGRRRTTPPPDGLDDVMTAAHDRIDEIELARVRSMLQRR